MTVRPLLAAAAVCGLLVPVSGANAAGPPLPSSASGKAGAVAPGGHERIITRRAGDDTRVVAVRRSDGAILRSRRIPGRWAIPAVTLDNATTGLSADGRTLVLARPTRAFPPKATRLAVLDVRTLVMRRRLTLPGFFTVDAVSPDGRSAYLIQYSDAILDYRVRALDTRIGRLDPRDVVDPREPGEQMGGLPMTRAMSPDGRWAYTLYGGGEEVFIHALDTVGRTAACIDLDMLPTQSDLSGVSLRVSDRQLRVLDRGEVVATVDARTFAVTEPGAQAPPAPPRPATAPPAASGSFPWPALVLVGTLAGLGAAALALRRGRARHA
jgi:hypothetical protein